MAETPEGSLVFRREESREALDPGLRVLGDAHQAARIVVCPDDFLAIAPGQELFHRERQVGDGSLFSQRRASQVFRRLLRLAGRKRRKLLEVPGRHVERDREENISIIELYSPVECSMWAEGHGLTTHAVLLVRYAGGRSRPYHACRA